MTRRELVKAAITHKPAPRVPYYILLTGELQQALAPKLGCSVEEYLDNDVIGLYAPWWNWHDLGLDWQRFDAPMSAAKVRGCGSYEAFADQVKAARDSTDKYIVVLIWGSHFEKAYFARGIENFLADMAGESAFAKKLLTTTIDKNMVMLENFLDMPEIDGVLLGSDWGSQRGLLMSPQVWDDMIRPGEQREYDLIHSCGKDVWVHSCGDVQELIPRLVEMGVNVLNPVQPECMDIQMLKQRYGHKLTFWGGISTQRLLPFGTPDEVKAESRRVKKLMSAGGGYLLSPSQELQVDVPLDNLKALLEVAREA